MQPSLSPFAPFLQKKQLQTTDTTHGARHQDSHLSVHYDVAHEHSGAQDLGHVRTPRGRLLAFPSTLQHRHHAYTLLDPSAPPPQGKPAGRLGVLAMHLVDPHVPILSTAHVPPQQRDWWARAVLRSAAGVSGLRDLPREVFDMVVACVDGGDGVVPLSPGEALAVKREVQRERTLVEEGMQEMIEDVCECFFLLSFSFFFPTACA